MSEMQVPKYYAVVRGREPGIYRSEKDAMSQIKDFKDSDMAIFDSEKAAIEYFNKDKGAGDDYYIPSEQVVLPSGIISAQDLGKFNDTSDFVTVQQGDPNNAENKPKTPDKSNDVPFNPDITVVVTGQENGFWGYAICNQDLICDSGVNIDVPELSLNQIALARALEQLYIIGVKDKKIEIAVTDPDLLKAMDMRDVTEFDGISPSKQDYIKRQLINFKQVHLTQINAAEDQTAVKKGKSALNIK